MEKINLALGAEFEVFRVEEGSALEGTTLAESHIRRDTGASILDEQLEYLVITEPLPAGTTVIKNSVSGAFDRWESTPGAITFYVGSRRHVGSIHYELHGYLPGKYRTAPTVIRNAYRPR